MENLKSCTPENFLKNQSEILSILENEKFWQKIPLINYNNLDNFKDLTLVRFRGMIQDMLDPEIYMEKYEITSSDSNSMRVQNGKFRDCLVLNTHESVNFDSTNNVHGERRTLFVVSVPGLNNWAVEMEKLSAAESELFLLEDISNSNVLKRQADNENNMDVDSTAAESNKKLKTVTENNNLGSQILSAEYLVNSPISERPGKACMVKIYSDFDSHCLNTLIDIVGFLSVDPALDGSTENPSEFQDPNELQATNPPPSLIPRIHAIAIRKLKHANPLLDQSLIDSTAQESLNCEAICKDLKIMLTQCLFGDVLAAEYLICHLISAVYIRTDMQTLGQFSLNLCNLPTEVLPVFTENFYEILEILLPASHYFPMTLENMNEKQFVPQKDYQTNKLKSGLLQLPPHTHLFLDETRLQTGKLETNGVLAVKNLAYLIQAQQLKYNFKFYEIDFNTDIPVLILSEGRSMLPSDLVVPLKPDIECIKLISETLKAAKHFLQPKLNSLRIYLTKCKLSNFKMNSEDTEMIQNDFVNMRKSNKKISGDALHSLLVISRLLGISRGKEILDSDCWQQAKDMEEERLARLEQLPKSKNTTRN